MPKIAEILIYAAILLIGLCGVGLTAMLPTHIIQTNLIYQNF